jgi:tRNA-modifying protein YgfZ
VDRNLVDALEAGRAFVDLSSWRKAGVGGAEGLTWLNDLVSANIDDLGVGRARRSLLLSPTGGVRAEFTVTIPEGGLLLIQDPAQPRSILDLLVPYVLSSDVVLDDRTARLALFAIPNRSTAPDVDGSGISTPSCIGPGADLIARAEDHDRIAHDLRRTLAEAGPDELEAWRVAAGLPRVGVDVAEDDLPQEGGFIDAVSFDKGCFLGQEAVAKVRNLGHPRRLLVQVEADEPLGPDQGVYTNGDVVGTITSAHETRALAKVRWSSREGPFRTSDGVELRLRT